MIAEVSEPQNYRLRPAKRIEQKMVADALHRLRSFDQLGKYRYVGLGSITFSEFSIFHRSLGINDMVSIERDGRKLKRVRFNRPFDCIEIEIGNAGDVVQRLDWQGRNIVWLDYTDSLSPSILDDLAYLAAELQSGSVLIATVNANHGHQEGRLGALRKRLPELVPSDYGKDEDLGGWRTAEAYQRIALATIRGVLADRNGVLDPDDQLQFEQLFNFVYQDRARMVTFGGILVSGADGQRFESAEFADLEFIRPDRLQYLIDVPVLTWCELRYLDRQLPGSTAPRAPGVPADDVERYRNLHRYFPGYVDADF